MADGIVTAPPAESDQAEPRAKGKPPGRPGSLKELDSTLHAFSDALAVVTMCREYAIGGDGRKPDMDLLESVLGLGLERLEAVRDRLDHAIIALRRQGGAA